MINLKERYHDSTGGLIIVDSSCLQVIFSNDEAVRILDYPRQRRKNSVFPDSLGEKVRNLLGKGFQLDNISATEFISGRRHYICQFVSMGTGAIGVHRPAVAISLERPQSVTLFLPLVADRFRLTYREQEALGLLCKGLSTKDIATEMNISPNTAKAFLRLVMLKMGVQGRSGILGSILQCQVAQLGAPPFPASEPTAIRRAS